MELSIVLSKPGEDEARIMSHSDLVDILHFLNLLGVSGWDLYIKGSAMLEINELDRYMAIGPQNSHDLKMFIKQARSFLDI